MTTPPLIGGPQAVGHQHHAPRTGFRGGKWKSGSGRAAPCDEVSTRRSGRKATWQTGPERKRPGRRAADIRWLTVRRGSRAFVNHKRSGVFRPPPTAKTANERRRSCSRKGRAAGNAGEVEKLRTDVVLTAAPGPTTSITGQERQIRVTDAWHWTEQYRAPTRCLRATRPARARPLAPQEETVICGSPTTPGG